MKRSQEIGKEYLLFLDVDRLMVPYYEAAGIETDSERYGGWEAREIGGHSLGHFLSAAAIMALSTEDEVLVKKVDKVLIALKRCQDADGNGYMCLSCWNMKIYLFVHNSYEKCKKIQHNSYELC